MTHLTSVDLPAPFSPRSAWNVPAATLTETLSSAVKRPKVLVIPNVSSEGPRGGGKPGRAGGAGAVKRPKVFVIPNVSSEGPRGGGTAGPASGGASVISARLLAKRHVRLSP